MKKTHFAENRITGSPLGHVWSVAEHVRQLSRSSTHLCVTVSARTVFPHLMCWRLWRAEGTSITARRCCAIFVILAPDTKLHTYLLTSRAPERLVLFMSTTCCSQRRRRITCNSFIAVMRTQLYRCVALHATCLASRLITRPTMHQHTKCQQNRAMHS